MITIPTITQLYNDILADLQAEYGTAIPTFGKNFLRVLAAVQAAKLKLYYLAIGLLQKNIFVDTADPQSRGGTLERFGFVKLGRYPFTALVGQYTVTVNGTVGAIIKASTTFKSNDDSLSPGKLFILDQAHTMVSTTDSITLRALDAGIGSKLLVADQLTATSPIENANRLATVTVQLIEPLDAEDIEAYRQKTIDAYRLEPNGGAASDYRLWAADVQGVKQAYPYAKTGAANEINLFIEATIADSIDGMGTPSASMLTDVEAVVELDPDTTKPINERGRRPLGIFQVHYLPVTIRQVDIEIPGFVGLTPAIQNAILAAITSLVNGIRPFVAGADVLESKNDILDTNRIASTILVVRPGSTFGTPILLIDSVPVLTFTFINGDIPFLNSVTYT